MTNGAHHEGGGQPADEKEKKPESAEKREHQRPHGPLSDGDRQLSGKSTADR
jgi:hypothetical protein